MLTYAHRLTFQTHVHPLQMHSIWDRYYADADGLIFVIDATDRGRFERTKKTLCQWSGAERLWAYTA